MGIIDISWGSILKVVGSGVFLYLVAPLLLILRDLLLGKVIEKWILTESLRDTIHLCEGDRWRLESQYNEPLIMDGGECYIGDKKVTEEEFARYEKAMWLLQDRFELLDSKIKFRSCIINYAINHFKNNGYVNPIDSLRASSYKHAEETNKYT